MDILIKDLLLELVCKIMHSTYMYMYIYVHVHVHVIMIIMNRYT